MHWNYKLIHSSRFAWQDHRAAQVAQWLQVLDAKADNLRWMPKGLCSGRRELTPASCLLTSACICARAHTDTWGSKRVIKQYRRHLSEIAGKVPLEEQEKVLMRTVLSSASLLKDTTHCTRNRREATEQSSTSCTLAVWIWPKYLSCHFLVHWLKMKTASAEVFLLVLTELKQM